MGPASRVQDPLASGMRHGGGEGRVCRRLGPDTAGAPSCVREGPGPVPPLWCFFDQEAGPLGHHSLHSDGSGPQGVAACLWREVSHQGPGLAFGFPRGWLTAVAFGGRVVGYRLLVFLFPAKGVILEAVLCFSRLGALPCRLGSARDGAAAGGLAAV